VVAFPLASSLNASICGPTILQRLCLLGRSLSRTALARDRQPAVLASVDRAVDGRLRPAVARYRRGRPRRTSATAEPRRNVGRHGGEDGSSTLGGARCSTFVGPHQDAVARYGIIAHGRDGRSVARPMRRRQTRLRPGGVSSRPAAASGFRPAGWRSTETRGGPPVGADGSPSRRPRSWTVSRAA
jgi:hypothetical protein